MNALDALKKLLYLSLLQVPLAGALVQWWEHALQQPFWAALLVLFYELVALLLSFSSKVWKQVWTEDLEPAAVAHVALPLKRRLRHYFSQFRQRYLAHIRQEQNVFNVQGLRTLAAFSLPLDKVFVTPLIHSTHTPQQANQHLLAKASSPAQNHARPLSDWLQQQALGTALVILGAPGSGKSTLLQALTLELAQDTQSQKSLPIFLRLRQLAPKLLAKPATLAEQLQTHFSDSQRYPHLNPPSDWFASALQAGQCTVLLDGLDEVADPNLRRTLAYWLEQQIQLYPHCHFVLTARPQGYLNSPLQHAHVLELLPFNAQQVQQFIRNWYQAVEQVNQGFSHEKSVDWQAQQHADALCQSLSEKPALSALTVNPLLLTMLTMVHHYRGRLPERRVTLYTEIVDVLLEHWQQAKTMDGVPAAASPFQALPSYKKRRVLEHLAAHMMQQHLREIAHDACVQFLRPVLSDLEIEPTEPDALLQAFQTETGLLLESELDTWRFAHLSFQEYLCACAWLKHQVPAHWDSLIDDSWWQETLRLYAAQTDATHLLEACLKTPSLNALTLAANCLQEAKHVDPALHSQLSQLLHNQLHASQAEHRELATQIHLRQRVQNLRAIDEHRAIDRHFISCGEYQLFIRDLHSQGEARQPDHWTQQRCPNTHLCLPITGLRLDDAHAFCVWLSQRQGGHWQYRLPTPEEALHYPPEPENEWQHIASFCASPDDKAASWVGLGDEAAQLYLSVLKVHNPLALPLPQHLAELYSEPLDSLTLDLDSAALQTLFESAIQAVYERDIEEAPPDLNSADPAHAQALLNMQQHVQFWINDLRLCRHLISGIDANLTEHLRTAYENAQHFHRIIQRDLRRNWDLTTEVDLLAHFEHVLPQVLQGMSEAQQRIAVLDVEVFPTMQHRSLRYCQTLLGLHDASRLERRQQWRALLAELLGQYYLASAKTGIETPSPPWQFWRRAEPISQPTAPDLEITRLRCWRAYWWLQVLQAREAGQLPAWEGLRVVQARVGTLESAWLIKNEQ